MKTAEVIAEMVKVQNEERRPFDDWDLFIEECGISERDVRVMKMRFEGKSFVEIGASVERLSSLSKFLGAETSQDFNFYKGRAVTVVNCKYDNSVKVKQPGDIGITTSAARHILRSSVRKVLSCEKPLNIKSDAIKEWLWINN